MMDEVKAKQEIIRRFLEEQEVDVLLLKRASSFAWATCGAASYINTASTIGEAFLLVSPNDLFLFTNNIESPRLEQEEGLTEQGWEFRTTAWQNNEDLLSDLVCGLKVGSDVPYLDAKDVSGELGRLRAKLTPEEGKRYKELGSKCAVAMNDAICTVKPGQTEHEIAGNMIREVEKRGVQVTLILVGTDQRIFSFRHPLPTNKKLDRYAMLIFCGRWKGLVCSITRFVHFGPLPDEIKTKSQKTAFVDANFIHATRPGKTIGDVFKIGCEAYNEVGYPEEWNFLHQGGSAGYEPRELIATINETEKIIEGQVFAWNPSITGTKSEDTILVGENENLVLTEIEGWPTIPVAIDGYIYKRPAIFEM